jgi:hypothetical protein
MSLRGFITESNNQLLLEGKMENELIAQIRKHFKQYKFRSPLLQPRDYIHVTFDLHLKKNQTDETLNDIAFFIAREILDIDPTPRKSWRFKIKEWMFNGEIVIGEDKEMLERDLKAHLKSNSQKMDFEKRSDLAEFVLKIKEKRAVDDIFSYTFDIDHSDNRFNIYHIQEKDKSEYLKKLGPCTTWCIATDQMFGRYPLPYYLLVDKKEKKQYAIVPSAGQFRDSKQNESNSEKRFEEFDEILDLRGKYYQSPPEDSWVDTYIYDYPGSPFKMYKEYEIIDYLEKNSKKLFPPYVDADTEALDGDIGFTVQFDDGTVFFIVSASMLPAAIKKNSKNIVDIKGWVSSYTTEDSNNREYTNMPIEMNSVTLVGDVEKDGKSIADSINNAIENYADAWEQLIQTHIHEPMPE